MSSTAFYVSCAGLVALAQAANLAHCWWCDRQSAKRYAAAGMGR